MFPGFFCSSQFCQKKPTFQKQNVVCFFKDKPKSCRSLCGCFAFSSNFDFSWLSQPFQTFLKPRDSESKGGLVPCPLLSSIKLQKALLHQTDLSSSISCHQSHNITWKFSSFNSKAFVFNFWDSDFCIQNLHMVHNFQTFL